MPRVHLWDWAPSRRLEGSGQKAGGLAPAGAVMWGEGSCRGRRVLQGAGQTGALQAVVAPALLPGLPVPGQASHRDCDEELGGSQDLGSGKQRVGVSVHRFGR